MDPTQAPMDPAAEAAMVAALEHFRETLTASITYTSCLFSVLCWDYVVTLPLEIKRFWRAKWVLSTYIFLFSRYIGLAGMITVMVMFNAGISKDLCKKSAWMEPTASLLGIIGAEAILVMRVYALWDRASWIICLFVVICSAETAVTIYAKIGGVPLDIPPQLNIHACIFDGGPSNAGRLWLARIQPIISDSTIIGRTLIRSWQLRQRADGAKIPILRILVRDGLIFYLIVLATNLLNLTWMKTKSITENQSMHAPLAMVVTTMAASRLALLMRDPAYIQPSSPPVSFGSKLSKPSTCATAVSHGSGAKSAYPLMDLRAGQKDETGDDEKIYSHYDVEIGDVQAAMDRQHINTRASANSSTY